MSTRTLLLAGTALAAALALGGCVVAPAPGYYGQPAGVAYVAPFFAAPGPAWVWGYHANVGWGWHGPDGGWRHR